MKYIVYSLFFAFFIASCQNGCGTSDNPEILGGNNPGPKPAPIPEMDSLTQKVFNMYTKDYWVVTGYFKSKVPGSFKANRGRWYHFRNDGTFTVGHFDKELSQGTWKIEQNATHIRLDAQDPLEDKVWRHQYKQDQSMTVWVGTEESQTTSVQQRLENLLFTPKNPKEMGWEE